MNDLYEIDFNHKHWRWASGLPEWLKKVDGRVYRFNPNATRRIVHPGLEAELLHDGVLVEVGERQPHYCDICDVWIDDGSPHEEQTPSTLLKVHTECENQPSVKVGVWEEIEGTLYRRCCPEDAPHRSKRMGGECSVYCFEAVT